MIWQGGTGLPVRIPAGGEALEGNLELPENPLGLVLFAHGSGSSRQSPRNQRVGRMLRDADLGTCLVDLLTPEEEQRGSPRWDIEFLAERLIRITEWLRGAILPQGLRLGTFGASTGAAAALRASVGPRGTVSAIVCRGGRPDLAGDALPRVEAPTLLIVGGNDEPVTSLNLDAYARIQAPKEIAVIPGASHLFEEPGALEQVGRLAAGWFRRFLPTPPPEDPGLLQ